jgi:hypothetical protein
MAQCMHIWINEFKKYFLKIKTFYNQPPTYWACQVAFNFNLTDVCVCKCKCVISAVLFIHLTSSKFSYIVFHFTTFSENVALLGKTILQPSSLVVENIELYSVLRICSRSLVLLKVLN